MSVEVLPASPERWEDLAGLFGERGALAGCWCMWWRLPAAEFDRCAGEGNRRTLRALVEEGRSPGLLAYSGSRAVGWCSVAPRSEFGRVERSPKIGPVDDRPAWSIVCFFVDRGHRRRGVAEALLAAAVEHAAAHGAELVEGYPVEAERAARDRFSEFSGTVEMFRRAGFVEAAHRGGPRRIMRREL